MKKLYTLFLTTISLLAISQLPSYEQQLGNYSGHITKIVYNGNEYLPPGPIGVSPTSTITTTNNQKKLLSSFYNSSFGNITFGENNANYFTISDANTTLAVYSGENEMAVRYFDGLANSFYTYFPENSKFYFETNIAGITAGGFVVTNPVGNKIYYDNFLLATPEIVKAKTRVYPNPTTDRIIIDNLGIGSSVQLFDNSGKLVKSLRSKSLKEEIDIKNLLPGIYQLRIEGQSVQKIIKK